ncbi:MAG: S-layer homology domain-containing protein, partial [Oscillospiraceae bacterium]|nr:S-layer homology domain-containing protein [Oscillospiraceae bacterium]
GGVVPGNPEGYWSSSEMNFPESQYIILIQGEMDEQTFYLFDRDYNLICQLDAYPNAIYPIAPLTKTTFLVRNPKGYTVLMNAKGEMLAELPGVFYTFIGLEDKADIDAPLDRFITCDGQNCYLYDKDGNLITTLEGATSPKNEGCYFTVKLDNTRYGLYDSNGTFLFEYTSDSGIQIRQGVILQEKKGKTAVLDRGGNPLTDYHFKLCQNTDVYGLIYATISGRDGFFLVNAAGQILHSEGFDSAPRVSGSYCIYEIGGKAGILRVLRPEDDLFMDVPRGMWYYDSVEACAQMELFNGTGPARFSPESTMTRAMLVTVLWRLEGEPTPEAPTDFVDVPHSTWYSKAVAWASENGIVNGVGNGRFAPDGNVTREQIATILCRYAQSKDVDIGGVADLAAYPDGDQVSSYALLPMAWANAVGLINGIKSGSTVTLQPLANATRAQVATILIRYIENIIAE